MLPIHHLFTMSFIHSLLYHLYFIRYLVIPVSLHVSEVEGSSDAQQSVAAHNVRDERSTNCLMYHFDQELIIVKSRAAVTRSEA